MFVLVSGVMTCRLDHKDDNYLKTNTTISGRTCQKWASQTVHLTNHVVIVFVFHMFCSKHLQQYIIKTRIYITIYTLHMLVYQCEYTQV